MFHAVKTYQRWSLKEFRLHYIHTFVTFYQKDGPLRRSSEYFFMKCMLCDSKLNLYFVGNIEQQGGQLGEGDEG